MEYSSSRMDHDMVFVLTTTPHLLNDHGVFLEGEYKETEPNLIVRHGMGKFMDAVSKSVYTGNWDTDKMHGKGIDFLMMGITSY
jgi:hypothetical protein